MAFNLILPKTIKELRKYFLTRFEVKDMGYKTPCHVWIGFINNKGYGTIGWGGMGKKYYAHRLAWFLEFGKHPSKWVLHKCDIRSCVRPDHLFEGTAYDNMQDMILKGRAKNPKGEDCWNAKVTASQVISMRVKRASGASVKSLALEYSISEVTASFICSGRTWGHVGGPIIKNPNFLTRNNRDKIIELWNSGSITQTKLGEMFSVDQSTISMLVRGKRRG